MKTKADLISQHTERFLNMTEDEIRAEQAEHMSDTPAYLAAAIALHELAKDRSPPLLKPWQANVCAILFIIVVSVLFFAKWYGWI